MHFLQSINSDISVLIVCNKTGGTIKGDIKKKFEDDSNLIAVTISMVYKHCSRSGINLCTGKFFP